MNSNDRCGVPPESSGWLVRISSIDETTGESVHGTGFLIQPGLVLTCRHVVEHISGTDDFSPDLGHTAFSLESYRGQDSRQPLASRRLVAADSDIDCALFTVDTNHGLPSAPSMLCGWSDTTWQGIGNQPVLCYGITGDGRPCHQRFALEKSPAFSQRGLFKLDLPGGGVPGGCSGGPALIQYEGRWHVIGMNALGGVGRACSVIVGSDRITEFLRFTGVEIPTTAVENKALTGARRYDEAQKEAQRGIARLVRSSPGLAPLLAEELGTTEDGVPRELVDLGPLRAWRRLHGISSGLNSARHRDCVAQVMFWLLTVAAESSEVISLKSLIDGSDLCRPYLMGSRHRLMADIVLAAAMGREVRIIRKGRGGTLQGREEIPLPGETGITGQKFREKLLQRIEEELNLDVETTQKPAESEENIIERLAYHRSMQQPFYVSLGPEFPNPDIKNLIVFHVPPASVHPSTVENEDQLMELIKDLLNTTKP